MVFNIEGVENVENFFQQGKIYFKPQIKNSEISTKIVFLVYLEYRKNVILTNINLE